MVEVKGCINKETFGKNDLFVSLALGAVSKKTGTKKGAGESAVFGELFNLYDFFLNFPHLRRFIQNIINKFKTCLYLFYQLTFGPR